jgi:hypothetical protein
MQVRVLPLYQLVLCDDQINDLKSDSVSFVYYVFYFLLFHRFLDIRKDGHWLVMVSV